MLRSSRRQAVPRLRAGTAILRPCRAWRRGYGLSAALVGAGNHSERSLQGSVAAAIGSARARLSARGRWCLACPAPRRSWVRRRCGAVRALFSPPGKWVRLQSKRSQPAGASPEQAFVGAVVLRLSFSPLLGSRCCVPSCVGCQRRRWRNVSIEFGKSRLAQAAHGAPSAACLCACRVRGNPNTNQVALAPRSIRAWASG